MAGAAVTGLASAPAQDTPLMPPPITATSAMATVLAETRIAVEDEVRAALRLIHLIDGGRRTLQGDQTAQESAVGIM